MNIEIANRLVQYRKTRGLSQEGLAAELGLSRQAVSKWERAEASPDTDNLIALARLYGVSIDTLLLNGEVPLAQTAAVTADTQQPNPTPVPSEQPSQQLWQQPPHGEPPTETSLQDGLYAHYRQLSPGARGLLKLIALAAGVMLFGVYCILSWIFPGLRDAYGALCTIVYLLLGFVCNLWHPGWLIFLTVPIYYSFF